MEREEVERTKTALQARAQAKEEEASRRRADRSETQRIKREASTLVKSQQAKEVGFVGLFGVVCVCVHICAYTPTTPFLWRARTLPLLISTSHFDSNTHPYLTQREAERAEMRGEYERAMAARKKEEEARRAALAKQREEKRAAALEQQRAKKAAAEEAKRKEQEDIKFRHEATKRRLAEAERARMEKYVRACVCGCVCVCVYGGVLCEPTHPLTDNPSPPPTQHRVEKNRREVEAQRERRRLSPSGPTLATSLAAMKITSNSSSSPQVAASAASTLAAARAARRTRGGAAAVGAVSKE